MASVTRATCAWAYTRKQNKDAIRDRASFHMRQHVCIPLLRIARTLAPWRPNYLALPSPAKYFLLPNYHRLVLANKAFDPDA